MKRQNNTHFLTQSGAIAAVYVLLTMLAAALGLDSGAIQLRLSEALTILPVFTPAAVPGLFVGCLLSNLLAGGVIWDVIFGSLATLLAALWTRRMPNKWLAPLPPVVCNAVIIGAMIAWYEVGFTNAFWGMFAFNALTVGIGEASACYVLGLLLLQVISRAPGLHNKR